MSKGEKMRLAGCDCAYSCITDNMLCDQKTYNPLCLSTYGKIRPEVTKTLKIVDTILT